MAADGRLELYAVADEGCDAYDIAAGLFGAVAEGEVAGALYFAEGIDVASHLFAALCGLDEFARGIPGRRVASRGMRRACRCGRAVAAGRAAGALGAPGLPAALPACWARALSEARKAATLGDALTRLAAAASGLSSALSAADASASTAALAETAVRNGVQMRCRSEVTAIRKIEGGYELQTASGPCRARRIVNAAGIRAAAVHDMIAPHAFSIHCARGEYYLLDKGEGSRVGHVIFQCPNRDGKGVLVAPTVHGNLIVGPNADENSGESVANTASGLAYVAKMAHKSVPTVDLRASIRNFAGVRALSDQEDFIIQEAKSAPGFIDLAGIKSPGLTAAPAIAREAVALLEQSGLALKPKAYFIDTREHLCFKDLSAQEKQELIEREPAYGRVICRCETITEGRSWMRSIRPFRRVRSTASSAEQAQAWDAAKAAFCGPRVLELLAKELGIDPASIPQDGDGTQIITGLTKGAVAHEV